MTSMQPVALVMTRILPEGLHIKPDRQGLAASLTGAVAADEELFLADELRGEQLKVLYDILRDFFNAVSIIPSLRKFRIVRKVCPSPPAGPCP